MRVLTSVGGVTLFSDRPAWRNAYTCTRRIVPRWCDPVLNKEIAGGGACRVEAPQLTSETQGRLNRALQALSSSTLAFGQITAEDSLLHAVCRIAVECGYRRAMLEAVGAEMPVEYV